MALYEYIFVYSLSRHTLTEIQKFCLLPPTIGVQQHATTTLGSLGKDAPMQISFAQVKVYAAPIGKPNRLNSKQTDKSNNRVDSFRYLSIELNGNNATPVCVGFHFFFRERLIASVETNSDLTPKKGKE